MNMESFNLKKYDPSQSEHQKFIKEMFSDEGDEINFYLGHMDHLNDEFTYLVYDKEDHLVGYFSMTQPTLNQMNLMSTSLYYAICSSYRGRGYATKLLQEVSEFLLEQVDVLVLMIDQNNIASMKVAKNAQYQISFFDPEEEDIIFVRYAMELEQKKRK